MKRLICALAILSLLALSACAMAEGSVAVQEAPKGKVVLYASLQEAQLQAIEQAFEAKYPDVDMEYCFAGGGKLVERMTEEARDGGQIAGDLVWLGDPSDFEAFKANGWLKPYLSPETEHIAEEYIDPEGYFTAARLVSMGIAWNTDLVDESAAPRTWNDLLDPTWSNHIVMTDPSQASTTKYWVAVMMQSPKYGADFFEKLRDKKSGTIPGSPLCGKMTRRRWYTSGPLSIWRIKPGPVLWRRRHEMMATLRDLTSPLAYL